MEFVKMHGTGNDFVMIDNMDKSITLTPPQVAEICHRNFGVGADGVILVESGREGGDCFMNYINADGSFAEMCGNGTRCTADFMVRYKRFQKPILALDTYGGRKSINVLKDHQYTVNMGIPVFAPHKDFPNEEQQIDGITWHFASMGNPHAVGFYGSEEKLDQALALTGASLEGNTDLFPNKINVNFVFKRGTNHFVVKTYERGAGLTMACGTGASASFAWMAKLGYIQGRTKVDVPGGTLYFEFNDAGEILMTGPSAVSFEGEMRF